MIQNAVLPVRIVLYEGAGSQPLEKNERLELVRSLLKKGYQVTRAVQQGAVSAMHDGLLLVLGRFTSALPELQSRQEGVNIQVQELGERTPAETVALVEETLQAHQTPAPGGWKPWFPVIDYDRCTNCMQCLSFCLFDVYGVENKKLKVINQNNCKTDCPACSRVCPEVAILFPKYKQGPINGDEINPEDLRREAMKVDISALLGGDIYAALRDRSEKAKSRFSKERDEDRALKERQFCLNKLQKALDIPDEVLAALPTMEQIQAKAARAVGQPATETTEESAV